jgi:hypothetical protein
MTGTTTGIRKTSLLPAGMTGTTTGIRNTLLPRLKTPTGLNNSSSGNKDMEASHLWLELLFNTIAN